MTPRMNVRSAVSDRTAHTESTETEAMRLKLIVALVSDEKTEIVIDAARAGGATGATVITSVRGEGLEPGKSFFGLELAAPVQRPPVPRGRATGPGNPGTHPRRRPASRRSTAPGSPSRSPSRTRSVSSRRIPTIMEALEDEI